MGWFHLLHEDWAYRLRKGGASRDTHPQAEVQIWVTLGTRRGLDCGGVCGAARSRHGRNIDRFNINSLYEFDLPQRGLFVTLYGISWDLCCDGSSGGSFPLTK